MRNFFESKLNKSNPFINKDTNTGDETKTMTDETKEIKETNETEITNENTEEISENEEKIEETKENEIVEETSETDKLKAVIENMNNQYLRLAADFDNYRKRQAQEREALLKYGKEECMKKIIEVVDNFERAMQSVDKIDNVEKMKETFVVLNKQLIDSLTKLGLEEIKAVGEKFDPNLHEAVMQTQTEEYPEETIVNELQKGYKLGDKVLRPAMVSVAVK